MRRCMIGPIVLMIIGLVIVAIAMLQLRTDNPEQELLDATILVNEHDGLSDYGLEQLDLLLDQAGYE